MSFGYLCRFYSQKPQLWGYRLHHSLLSWPAFAAADCISSLLSRECKTCPLHEHFQTVTLFPTFFKAQNFKQLEKNKTDTSVFVIRKTEEIAINKEETSNILRLFLHLSDFQVREMENPTQKTNEKVLGAH